MKKHILLLISLTFLIFSCKGPDGPAGPAGQPGNSGPQGTEGKTGPQGESGSIGVKDTGWFKLDFSNMEYRNFYGYRNAKDEIYRTTIYLHLKNKEQPLFTKDILDKGVIFMYAKHQTWIFDLEDRSHKLIDQIYGSGTINLHHYFLSGEKESPPYSLVDFASIQLVVNDIQENYWDPYIYFSSPYNTVSENGVAIQKSLAPGINGQKLSFYQNLLIEKNPEIRVITMEGTQVGRLKNINWENYEETMEQLGLEP